MDLKRLFWTLFLAVGVFAAMVMDIILFESLKKMTQFKMRGQNLIASAEIEGQTVKLNYNIEGQDYFILKDKSPMQDLLNETPPKIELIFDKKNPEGAVTLREYKFMDSFFIPMILGFLVLSFAIFIYFKKLLKKIID